MFKNKISFKVKRSSGAIEMWNISDPDPESYKGDGSRCLFCTSGILLPQSEQIVKLVPINDIIALNPDLKSKMFL